MAVVVLGLDKLESKYSQIAPLIKKEAKAILINGTSDIKQYARLNHDFKSKSGALISSIRRKTTERKKGIKASSFIDGRFLASKKGFNYGWAQHDGTGSGYRPSPISPKVSPHRFKNSGGIKADHFLYRASEKYSKKILKQLNDISNKIKRMFKK